MRDTRVIDLSIKSTSNYFDLTIELVHKTNVYVYNNKSVSIFEQMSLRVFYYANQLEYIS